MRPSATRSAPAAIALIDVGAAAERSVDHDLGAAGRRIDDFRKHLHRSAAVVELPTAVVRNVDPVDAVIDRDAGVLGRPN